MIDQSLLPLCAIGCCTHDQSWLRGYKNFFHAQLSLKFILLINVKKPTIVGILTFISMIYIYNIVRVLKQEMSFLGGILVFKIENEISCSVMLSMKNGFITWGQIF